MSLTLLVQRNMVKLKLVPLRCFNYGDQQAGTVLDSLRACVGGGRGLVTSATCQPATREATM